MSDTVLISDSDDEVIEKSYEETPTYRNVPVQGSFFNKAQIQHRSQSIISISSDDEEDENGRAEVHGHDRHTIKRNVGVYESSREDISLDIRTKDSTTLSFGTFQKLASESNCAHSGEEHNDVSHVHVPLAAEGNDSDCDLAISLVKEEIGVGNVDLVAAQERALLMFKIDQSKDELEKSMLLVNTNCVDVLPNKGESLHANIARQKEEIAKLKGKLNNTQLYKIENNLDKYDDQLDTGGMFTKPTSDKVLGKKAETTLNREFTLIEDRLQDLHGSLITRPTADQLADEPPDLKVTLMPHQRHALAWLMWREQQKPSGGVLADDMGLGKTLTMISLILVDRDNRGDQGLLSDSDNERISSVLCHKGGTLVVCPASLLSQWQAEIKSKCKRDALSVEVYHDYRRERVAKRLAEKDVVITTYNILKCEFKTNSTLHKIHWRRTILDEAHIIRNHKNQASEAVCGLTATYRWALTGTPIQNGQLDLYSVLKFLKCSPFNNLHVWKRCVDDKNDAGRQRLAIVMESLMLRRTKQELQTKGHLESLPEKFVEEIPVKLDKEEQLVYEKVLTYCRTLFTQFLAERATKGHMAELGVGKFDKPTFLSNPNKNRQFTKAQEIFLRPHTHVKPHEILVLLLRLRQICVHPYLINAMLDQEDMEASGITETNSVGSDLLSRMNKIQIHEGEDDDAEEEDIGIDTRVTTTPILTSDNPVFERDRISSKMRLVLNSIQEILQKGDKIIVVSQWLSMLDVVALHLAKMNIKESMVGKFTGEVPIKDRQAIQDAFNAEGEDPRILLFSLTAGGVGLNLVGGNNLLLIDIHWNPQLEAQVQDRIYRFGQKKNVYIYRFICKNTIEESIKDLQTRKMKIAKDVLSGEGTSTTSKLTLNDLKSLFSL